MSEKPVEILLVEDDIELAQMIERHFIDALYAHVTHVTSAGEALCEELTARHDLAIVSVSLSDPVVIISCKWARSLTRLTCCS